MKTYSHTISHSIRSTVIFFPIIFGLNSFFIPLECYRLIGNIIASLSSIVVSRKTFNFNPCWSHFNCYLQRKANSLMVQIREIIA